MLEMFSYFVNFLFVLFAFYLLSDKLIMQAVRWRLNLDKIKPLIVKVLNSGKVELQSQKDSKLVWLGKDAQGKDMNVKITNRWHYLPTGVPVHFVKEGKATNLNLNSEFKGSYEDKELRDLLGESLVYSKAREEIYKLEKKEFPWKWLVLIGGILLILVIFYVFYGDVLGIDLFAVLGSTPAQQLQPGITPG